ncbi:ABC transporter permease [Clostridioides difficile]|uniref:ABC transporter permease n=1 Tax=Clostridioides difficile TaxID=1496 RepID=UPI000D1DA98E|nr:ABC transporter permease [Clostridioides difficile]UWD40736.1 ABC transporter permease [Clostridioides difficile]UWD44523.1 ABC transporter permease [Clostridioides difficile]VFF94174.1 ABC transporter permease [Clostridioides difficile]VIF99125.1 ABC transporter permease [Clostridioides difficile]VIG13200.1 ABC transporter permease [Clostridioides difficile]
MSKKFKTFIMSCLISVSTIGVMGTTSFADGIEGTERFIPKGEGEISISSENARSSGTSSSSHISSLSMGNQLINGSYRSYPTGTHTISMKVVEKTSPNLGLPNYCMGTLQKYKLGGEGIDAFPKSTVGLLDELYKTIIYIGTIISITIFIISIINISLNNVNDLKKRQSELGMLKAFGYKNRQLKKIIIYESTIINIFSLFIGLVICKLIFLLLNTIVKNYLSIYMSDLKFEINLISITIGIFIMIFSVILSNLKSISYITNLNPIHAIRSKY